jgi:hypothetical protein
MKDFIRYKREVNTFQSETELQNYFNTLISEGWEIIHYNEKSYLNNNDTKLFSLTVTMVLGKRQA